MRICLARSVSANRTPDDPALLSLGQTPGTHAAPEDASRGQPVRSQHHQDDDTGLFCRCPAPDELEQTEAANAPDLGQPNQRAYVKSNERRLKKPHRPYKCQNR
jgi:hypothetical protein